MLFGGVGGARGRETGVFITDRPVLGDISGIVGYYLKSHIIIVTNLESSRKFNGNFVAYQSVRIV